MRALRFLYFKRSFVIARGLRDEAQPGARGRARRDGGLHFPHAFNPLARIFREHDDPRVRRSRWSRSARSSLEAGEFLVMVLRQEGGALRDVAAPPLAQMDNADVLPILKKHLELEAGPARQPLEQIVRALSVRA